MKALKVILATLVIFAAGVVTGGLIVKNTQRKPAVAKAQPQPYPGEWMQDRLFQRMKQELNLTPEQLARLEKIFGESRERVRELWGLLAPEMETERRETKERIRAELTPEQQKRFEELLKERPSHRGGRRGEKSAASNDVRHLPGVPSETK